jgi:hypothetical protein
MSAETILGAVGAGGAVAALFALWQNHKLTARSDSIQERLVVVEEGRRDDEVALRHREQAERVSCWVVYEMVDDDDSLVSSPTPTPFLCVGNGSDLPVYDVVIVDHVHWAPGDLPAAVFTMIPPNGTTPRQRWLPDRFGTWWPSEEPMPVLTFLDAQSVLWHRDEWGRLHEGPSLHPSERESSSSD